MISSNLLLWIFAALFILFGLPLLLTDDIGAQRTWGGLSALNLGGFAITLAYNATTTGRIRLQYSSINRSAQPRTFWAAVGLIIVAGVIVTVAGTWLIFFKV